MGVTDTAHVGLESFGERTVMVVEGLCREGGPDMPGHDGGGSRTWMADGSRTLRWRRDVDGGASPTVTVGPCADRADRCGGRRCAGADLGAYPAVATISPATIRWRPCGVSSSSAPSTSRPAKWPAIGCPAEFVRIAAPIG